MTVREILAEVAAQPPGEWRRLLVQRFPDDPLLVRQAELWLQATETKGPRELRPSLGTAGDRRYELTIKLDNGATAAVWQAFDTKLARNVAIKILHGTGSARLIDEARAACDVISDHVVRILDVHDGAPHPYIVMELVGEHDPEHAELVLGTAASACRPRSVAEATRWVMQVARGVADAHARNVFHRDLKPDNVLITPISRYALIADFGLAVTEHADASATPLVSTTAAGPICVRGTPEYMAPEQARGLPLQLDPRVARDRSVLVGLDVWGLGVILYELVCGRPLWIGDRESEPWELAASGARTAIAQRTPWGERIPTRLRRIIAKALASDPRDRYHAAAHVGDELAAFLAHRPTSFDRGRAARMGLWCRRNPKLALAATVAASLVALTLLTRSTVARLRDDRDALTAEVASQQDELSALTARVAQMHANLDHTAQRLEERAAELARLEHSIELERTTYEGLLEKKEAALEAATTTTRKLVDQLDAARAEIELGRQTHEHELATAHRDAETVSKERDKARGERDKARGERDALKLQRDAAATERDDARRALTTLQQELARLAADRSSDGGDHGTRQ